MKVSFVYLERMRVRKIRNKEFGTASTRISPVGQIQ